MVSTKPLALGAVGIGLALAGALAFESVYYVQVRTRHVAAVDSEAGPPSAANGEPAADTRQQTPLPLRLVDSGGVGIPLAGDWSRDYSHDLRTFREVILDKPPYIEASALRSVDRQWREYVERMLGYGNNAVAVPLLLELIDFNRVGDPAVYPAASHFRARHEAVRRSFAPLFDWAHHRGMQVFLTTDMLPLTAPLARHLRERSPSSNTLGIDVSDPAVWQVYRAGLEELFDRLPSIDGVVIRFGEAGSLYNTEGWDYRTAMAIRDARSLRAMLHGLLPLFEARGKTLVLRSWTVGVGQLGRLHVDPRVYQAVLRDIDSPALIVSTKFTAGDFFSHLPLNPTLLGGRHRRLVELQARPEFEGFGAFPNFLGEEHARALRVLTAANPQIVGTYVWSQLGGPLRAGPRSLYPLHGFWLWTDANVFAASQLALDRTADVHQLATRWAARQFGDDPKVAAAIANLLMETRDAIRKGFYIRPFAEREVRVAGLELPPLMWVFEWDRLGGWHSLLSIVYRGSRDQVAAAIDEGNISADRVRRARHELVSALGTGVESCAPVCQQALRSLEYQETLFDALAAWRQAFLSYYRWLETGDRESWTLWHAGRERFEAAEARHVARFGDDLNFPAFDLGSARQAVTIAGRTGWTRTAAAALLITMLALLVIGTPAVSRVMGARLQRLTRFGRQTWMATCAPWRLAHAPPDPALSIAIGALGLVLVAFVAGALAGFTTVWVSIWSLLVAGSMAFAFGTCADASCGEQRGLLILAIIGPTMAGSLLLLALLAFRGPLGFWYGFWISAPFRITVVTGALATVFWTASAMLAARPAVSFTGRAGGVLVATGVGLLAMTVTLPGWVDVLRLLDRPLNFAPATDTMLIALQTYVGVSLAAGALPWVLAMFLLVVGIPLSRRGVATNGRLL